MQTQRKILKPKLVKKFYRWEFDIDVDDFFANCMNLS